MKKLTIAAIILSIAIASCKTSKKLTDVAVPIDDTIVDNSFRKPIHSKELYASVTELIPLDTVYISKDMLYLLTKRITGCDEANFKLIWNGMMLKSLPPQTNVKLFQQADPACKESHRFLLSYNIKALRFKEDSVSLGQESMWSKVTVVKVGGWKNILKYEFQDAKH